MSINDRNPITSITTNIVGTANVAKICHKYGIKFIYISTDFVYDNVNIFIHDGDYCGIKKRVFNYDDFYIEWYKNKGLGELDKSLSNLATGYFYDGKCFVVSKDFSHFIGQQRGIAKIFTKRLSVEDVMIGFIYREMYED